MFKRLMERAEKRALDAAEATRRTIETALVEVSDLRVRSEGDTLVIEALGLTKRWLNDARIRFARWRRA